MAACLFNHCTITGNREWRWLAPVLLSPNRRKCDIARFAYLDNMLAMLHPSHCESLWTTYLSFGILHHTPMRRKSSCCIDIVSQLAVLSDTILNHESAPFHVAVYCRPGLNASYLQTSSLFSGVMDHRVLDTFQPPHQGFRPKGWYYKYRLRL